jgi:hypothetical protein
MKENVIPNESVSLEIVVTGTKALVATSYHCVGTIGIPEPERCNSTTAGTE